MSSNSRKSILPQLIVAIIIGIALPFGAYKIFLKAQEDALAAAQEAKSESMTAQGDAMREKKKFEADRRDLVELQKLRESLEASFLPSDVDAAKAEASKIGQRVLVLADRLCAEQNGWSDVTKTFAVGQEKKQERGYVTLKVTILTTSEIATELADYIERQRYREEGDSSAGTTQVYYCSGMTLEVKGVVPNKTPEIHNWTLQYIFPQKLPIEKVQ